MRSRELYARTLDVGMPDGGIAVAVGCRAWSTGSCGTEREGGAPAGKWHARSSGSGQEGRGEEKRESGAVKRKSEGERTNVVKGLIARGRWAGVLALFSASDVVIGALPAS